MSQPTIFISYSHEDEQEKNALLKHLGVLQSTGLIDLWSDDRIGAGADWQEEIEQAIAQATVAILLVSASFLTSEFALHQEVPVLLERRNNEGLVVFPVIIKACAWKTVDWLQRMKVRPKNGKPVWSMGTHVDDHLAAIVEEVASIVNKQKSALAESPRSIKVRDISGTSKISEDTIKTAPINVKSGQVGEVFSLDWSPDNQMLLSGNDQGFIRIWDTQSWQELRLKAHKKSIFDLEYSRSGRYIISGGNDRSVNLWNSNTLDIVTSFDKPLTPVYSIACSPDEQIIASGTIQGELVVWYRHGGKKLLETRNAHVVLGLTFSPDGRYLAASFSHPDEIVVFDTETFKAQIVFEVERKREREKNTFLRKLQFNPSGTYLATASFDGIVRVWDFYNKNLVSEFDDGRSYFSDVSFDPTGTQIACGCTNGDVGIWNIKENREMIRLYGHGGYTKAVAYNRTGQMLASGSRNTICIWNSDPSNPAFGQCLVIIGSQ